MFITENNCFDCVTKAIVHGVGVSVLGVWPFRLCQRRVLCILEGNGCTAGACKTPHRYF